ncbi:MAG: molecular chaperone DnaJ [Rhodospirillaceae bacterium]|nr:molecular chaperone DnaJ [Rhodospirillaceae bacterium]
MPYLLLSLAIVIGLYLVFRGLRRTNPRNLQKMLAFVVVIIVITILGFFAVSGRMGPFGWAMLALPLLLRWRAISQTMRNMRGPTPGKNSNIETAYLRMTLEHDSGVLSGTVLQGQFEGRNLEELSFQDLIELLRECRVNDPQSATVLETYLDRVHGPEWRALGDDEASAGAGGGARAGSGGPMTREQAYEVLGLQVGALEAEIRHAHRKLLMANHPDKGGSTFLAAQINEAKDVLLTGT